MKTVLFVPGYQENIDTRNYRKVLKAIEDKGYFVEFIPIKWQRTTILNWVEDLNAVYSKFDPANTILAGFSYGSLTAFMAATECNPVELWLYSFSPYFAEDIPFLKKSWLTRLGHRRVDAFRRMSYEKLAKNIHCRTLVFIGELEAKKYPDLERRAKIASQTLANDQLVYVRNCGHDVSDDNYVAAIASYI